MFVPCRVARTSRRPLLLLVGLAWAGGGACTSGNPELAANEQVTGASTVQSNKVDVLVMVDNSSSMTTMQQKMLAEFPVFVQTLSLIPGGLPDLHLAVISSDMGAPSDAEIGCTDSGNGGNFFSQPEGPCTATGLQPGATFITDDATGATKNFSGADPAALSNVFQCIALLGSGGCGFEHQLASIARALGADGSPAPTGNSGFLRPDAELAIVLLTNEDDCSAPASISPLPIYSLNGAAGNNLETPGGPLGNYRCNGAPYGGHLCKDPTAADPNALAQPPLDVPADASGNPPTLTLADCESDDTGSSELTTISSLIAGIKALKGPTGPEIVVGAIMAPATPYTVEWTPGFGASNNELFPNIEHSCSVADGSFGDPPVRIAQFVQAFGDNGVTQSICDSSYAPAFSLIASKIASHLPGNPGSGGGVDAGSTGVAGSGGHAGTNGQGGFPGGTGSGGTSGSAGTNGQGATTGSAGTNGAAGTPGGTGGTPGSAGGASGNTGGTSGGAGTNGSGGTSGGGGTKGAGGSSATGTGGSSATGSAGAGGAPDGGQDDGLGKGSGCDCGVGGSAPGAWGFLPLLGLLFVRRTRRRG
jgi:MYXO-CTERM domain-containing protein